jgi:hypothetical protein
MRVSFVLTAGLLLAYAARRNAAIRHAILVAGLAAAFIMPAAMLTIQNLSTNGVGSGIENIPFLGTANPADPVNPTTANAFVFSAAATFWIKWVRIPGEHPWDNAVEAPGNGKRARDSRRFGRSSPSGTNQRSCNCNTPKS